MRERVRERDRTEGVEDTQMRGRATARRSPRSNGGDRGRSNPRHDERGACAGTAIEARRGRTEGNEGAGRRRAEAGKHEGKGTTMTIRFAKATKARRGTSRTGLRTVEMVQVRDRHGASLGIISREQAGQAWQVEWRIGETTHRSALPEEYRYGNKLVRDWTEGRRFAVIEMQFGVCEGGTSARTMARKV